MFHEEQFAVVDWGLLLFGFLECLLLCTIAILAFAVEASEPILAMDRWTKMFANTMRISCFMKNILLWLSGICCCLRLRSAFFFAPSAIMAFAVEASKPNILVMDHWTKMFAMLRDEEFAFHENNFQWFVELSVVKLIRN